MSTQQHDDAMRNIASCCVLVHKLLLMLQIHMVPLVQVM